jgi:hypothetical protein
MGHVKLDVLFAVGQFRVPGEDFSEGSMIGAIPIVRTHCRALDDKQKQVLVALLDQSSEVRTELGRVIKENDRIEALEGSHIYCRESMPEFGQIFVHVNHRINEIIPNISLGALKHPVLVVLPVKIVKT